jgi:hypothetical protein
MGISSPKYESCMMGCVGRISHTNFKNRMVISRIATSKNHIELLILMTGPRSDLRPDS